MKVEFSRPDDEQKQVVATAIWDGRDVTVASEVDGFVEGLTRAFRRTPAAIDDGAYRRLGTHGSVVIQPGSLEWFRAVSQTRAMAETGLVVRFVPGAVEGGYDPAANYRPFEEQMERVDARSR